MIIAPSVLTANLADLGSACDEAVEAGLDWLHLDVNQKMYAIAVCVTLPLVEARSDLAGSKARTNSTTAFPRHVF